MAPDTLIELAKQELLSLIPWMNLKGAEWATLAIDRAEPQQPGLMRPDNAFLAPAPGACNLLVGWPTKLALAPDFADRVIASLARDGIQPGPVSALPPLPGQPKA